ncbi:ATP-binding cassette domain-containing protein [Microbacterium invictum]|uniref:ATP-binding cassette domain-containing protein n=1 Tax=Microbacterium invictum TaxID=515415 RepID=A0ABZ0VH64_9MICO|nr:ATP-binding cassette domain-containing protein [Microbacterium invictum]WQB71840.1 ATP-binding cassette domain-containing protein [Microbacterium invictum]
MTPSLPMPDDADTARAASDDDGVVAREVEIKLVPLLPRSETDETPGTDPRAPTTPTTPTEPTVKDAAAPSRAPRAPRAPRKTPARKTPVRKSSASPRTPRAPRPSDDSVTDTAASIPSATEVPAFPPAEAVVVPQIPPLPSVPADAIVIPPRPPLPPVAETVPDDAVPPPVEAPAEVSAVEDATPDGSPVVEALPLEVPTEEPAPAEAVDDGAERVSDEVSEEPDEVRPTAPEAAPLALADSLDLPEPDLDHAALTVRGVSKSFGGTRAVDGIDLTIPAGTFYGLVGPNGAGKTTTLSMIAGLLRPDRGTIRVGDIDAGAKPLQAKKLMGVLPDRLRTFDRLTGRQLLYYYGVLRGLPSSVVEARSADLTRAFDLTDALHRVVSDYSAGMVKKIMLAGALIHSPRLLVLDEPFESVDPVSSAVILDILSAYVSHGGTVILSSHGMEFVERVCSRVAVIVAGQVLAEGTIDEVRGELTLEQRFIELAGGLSDVEGLEWLHTFSD